MKRFTQRASALILSICSLILLGACSNHYHNPTAQTETYTGVPLIILDTDIGSSTDDLFALAMLYRYEEQDRCRLLGVVVDREGAPNAGFVALMNWYFGHPDVPVGLIRDGIKDPKIWIDYAQVANTHGSNGQPLFGHTAADPGQLPDGWQLYRKLLAAQPDHSVSIVSVGFVTCLAQLLSSGADEYSPLNGVDLVRKKVRAIYLQGGVFGPAGEPDYNLLAGFSYSRTFFSLWPREVEMVFSPMEAGQSLDYTPDKVIADVPWTEVHPIKQVYLQCTCDTGQRMWDALTVIQAVEGDELFSLSPRGTVQFTEQGRTIFTPSATGNCRYQLPGDAAWNEMILEKIRDVNRQAPRR